MLSQGEAAETLKLKFFLSLLKTYYSFTKFISKLKPPGMCSVALRNSCTVAALAISLQATGNV